MGRKRMSDEERKKRKRESERNRRENVRKDNVLREVQRRKDHERYEKNKENKVVKLIKDLTPKAQKNKRKIWKKHTQTYRAKQKIIKKMISETPPMSDEENLENQENPNKRQEIKKNTPSCSLNASPFITSSRQKNRGRTLMRRDRAKCYKNLAKLREQNKILKRRMEVWKKRYYRRSEKDNEGLTPNTKVNQMVKNYTVPQEIKKKLLFGEVLHQQLSLNFKQLERESSKQIFTKAINGRLLRKYRLLKEAQGFLPYKLYYSNKNRIESKFE